MGWPLYQVGTTSQCHLVEEKDPGAGISEKVTRTEKESSVVRTVVGPSNRIDRGRNTSTESWLAASLPLPAALVATSAGTSTVTVPLAAGVMVAV